MRELLAAKEWRTSSRRDASGGAWHISKGGQVLPVVVSARAELVKLDGNDKPYFSITGEVYNPRSRRRGGDGCIMGGCIHDVIVSYWPQVQPLVNLHLSDIDGVPMHAADNAAYWAGLTKYQPLDVERLTRHLRITADIAADMVAWVGNFYGDNADAYDAITTPAMAWAAAIEEYDLATRWAAEASEARGMLHEVARGAA